MRSRINQGEVIEALNAYLTYHNLPLQLEIRGICNGLACQYTKFYLAGNEVLFFELLKHVAGKKPHSSMENTLNHFVADIVQCCDPEKYNRRFCQENANHLMSIDGKRLTSSFQLALVTSDKNWEKIISSLSFSEGEVMKIMSSDHSISVTKRDDTYFVYDPECNAYQSEFRNVQTLVKALHTKIFYYPSSLLGLSINIIRHPNAPDKLYPSVKSIYNTYLSETSVNKVAKCHGTFLSSSNFLTLEHAAYIHNVDAINALIALGATDVEHQALANAVLSNNVTCIPSLLQFVLDKEAIYGLLLAALEAGQYGSFFTLLENTLVNTFFNEIVSKPANAEQTLRAAARGGDLSLLRYTFEFYQAREAITDIRLINTLFKEKKARDIITEAIFSGQRSCVRYLIEQLQRLGYSLNVRQTLFYLSWAIKNNHRDIVGDLLCDLSCTSPIRPMIYMRITDIDNTDLDILRQLREIGVNFGYLGEAAIARKAHEKINTLQLLGIMLRKFTDFLINSYSHCKGIISKTSDSPFQSRYGFFQARTSNHITMSEAANLVDAEPPCSVKLPQPVAFHLT